MYFATPLLNSAYFDQPTLLKLENTQPSGSFKSRGLTHLVATEAAGRAHPHVYASSGGNAGMAAAEAAVELGIPCTVAVPTTTKPRMRERLQKLGAEVIVLGSVITETDAHLRELIEKANGDPIYCHPFDHPLIWTGHSTMVSEIADQIRAYKSERPAAIVLSCGGGGLYIGVMEGLERVGWADKVPVYVVETEGAPTFHEALKAGKSVALPSVSTVATSLASVHVPERAVQYAQQYGSQSVLVSDDEALRAVRRFATDHDTIVEPACAATLAAIYRGDLKHAQGPVVAIVCGGTGYGPDDIK